MFIISISDLLPWLTTLIRLFVSRFAFLRALDTRSIDAYAGLFDCVSFFCKVMKNNDWGK